MSRDTTRKKHPMIGFIGMALLGAGICAASVGTFHWWQVVAIVVGMVLLVYAVMTGNVTMFG